MQTANRGCVFLASIYALIQIPFDFHPHLTYTMRLIPMHFSQTYRTIREAYIGNPFSLAPTATTKTRLQFRQLAYRTTDSDSFSISDLTDNLEIHIHIIGCNQFYQGNSREAA